MISFGTKALLDKAHYRSAAARRRPAQRGQAKPGRAPQSAPDETLTLSLPTAIKQYLEEQVHTGVYASVGEYVRQLVRADQKRQAKEELEQSLLDAIQSGDELAITEESIEQLRRMREDQEDTQPHARTASF